MNLPYACVICRAWSWSAAALCESCALKMFEWRAPIRRELPLPMQSLFQWKVGDPKAYSWMVRGMKGVEDPARWRLLASWMCAEFSVPKATVWVPIPSKGPNHALGLARALGELTGYPLADVLKMKSSQSQKSLSRRERGQIRFETLTCNSFMDVTIVDDVVTTGATARAAYLAMGEPKHAQLWSILDRRPCGRDNPLL